MFYIVGNVVSFIACSISKSSNDDIVPVGVSFTASTANLALVSSFILISSLVFFIMLILSGVLVIVNSTYSNVRTPCADKCPLIFWFIEEISTFSIST